MKPIRYSEELINEQAVINLTGESLRTPLISTVERTTRRLKGRKASRAFLAVADAMDAR